MVERAKVNLTWAHVINTTCNDMVDDCGQTPLFPEWQYFSLAHFSSSYDFFRKSKLKMVRKSDFSRKMLLPQEALGLEGEKSVLCYHTRLAKQQTPVPWVVRTDREIHASSKNVRWPFSHRKLCLDIHDHTQSMKTYLPCLLFASQCWASLCPAEYRSGQDPRAESILHHPQKLCWRATFPPLSWGKVLMICRLNVIMKDNLHAHTVERRIFDF